MKFTSVITIAALCLSLLAGTEAGMGKKAALATKPIHHLAHKNALAKIGAAFHVEKMKPSLSTVTPQVAKLWANFNGHTTITGNGTDSGVPTARRLLDTKDPATDYEAFNDRVFGPDNCGAVALTVLHTVHLEGTCTSAGCTLQVGIDEKSLELSMCSIMEELTAATIKKDSTVLSSENVKATCSMYFEKFCELAMAEIWLDFPLGTSQAWETAEAVHYIVEKDFNAAMASNKELSSLVTVAPAPVIPALGEPFSTTVTFPTPIPAITTKIAFEGIDADFLKSAHALSSDEETLCQLSKDIVYAELAGSKITVDYYYADYDADLEGLETLFKLQSCWEVIVDASDAAITFQVTMAVPGLMSTSDMYGPVCGAVEAVSVDLATMVGSHKTLGPGELGCRLM